MSARYVVLTGGVGGAKLVDGLFRLLPPHSLTAIVNTGDDFRHLGLPISPDIDTLLYTLAGKANHLQGWGREGETWSFMKALETLGGETWFNLGDGDLALHVMRGAALADGKSLSEIVKSFAAAWALPLSILPMSDNPVSTWLKTDTGWIPFQQYFVAQKCEPTVFGVRYDGDTQASPAPGVLEAIRDADAIFVAPSNPWLSIDPILSVPGIREALRVSIAPVIAVSPLIAGRAVKGPTAKLMTELNLDVTNQSIADHYEDILDGLLVHTDDIAPSQLSVQYANILMRSADDRHRVARTALQFALNLSK